MVYLKNNTSYLHKKTGLIYYYKDRQFIVINPFDNKIECFTEEQMKDEIKYLTEDKFEDLKDNDYEQ